jgi:hypothetical protein
MNSGAFSSTEEQSIELNTIFSSILTQGSSQARLLLFAPELYFLLEPEARAQGLPTPNRAKLERSTQEQGLR